MAVIPSSGFLSILVLLAVGLPLSSLAEKQTDRRSSAQIQLGAISVLTGAGAAWGVNHQRATILAVEEWNTRAGDTAPKFNVTFADSPNGLGRNAVTAYSQLVKVQQTNFILGPVMQDELLALLPRALKDGVFLMGATYAPSLAKNFFSTWIDADFESDLIARRVFERFQRVAVLGSQQSWEPQVAGRFRQTFADLGGQIVSFQEPSFEAVDVRTEVLKACSHNPAAIFISRTHFKNT